MNSVRDLLMDRQLPGGLAPEVYLRRRLDRLGRFDVLIEDILQRERYDHRSEKHASTPPAITPTVVMPVTAEILVTATQVSEQLLREIKVSPGKLRTISHRAFEELVAFLWQKFGYDIELTAQTRDGGRDIIAIKRAEVDVKYLIECKHPSTSTKIGISPVRELYAVKVDEGATKAILATTSYLTKDAALFVERHKWELEAKNYDDIMDWVAKAVVC